MMIPCLWSLLFGFDALTGVGWKGAPAAASFLVDIPRGLGTAHESKPHWGFDCLRCASARAFRVLYRHQQKIPGRMSEDFCGGALPTAVEPLSRHIVAAVRALQTEKRRHFGTLQPLLVCFFQLIFVQGNAVQQITLILGSCIVINAEPFADCAELVKHFNSSRGHSFDFNIHGSTTFQERYVLKSESAALSASISMIGPPDCLAKTRIAPKSRI